MRETLDDISSFPSCSSPGDLGLRHAGLNHFFPNFFQSQFFQKVWKILEKCLEKSLETCVNSKGTCFFGHYMSDALQVFFRADIRRYDHVVGYDDENFKKAKPTRSSAGPVCYSPVPAQGHLRRRLQKQRCTRKASPSRRINHLRCYGSGDGQAIQWALIVLIHCLLVTTQDYQDCHNLFRESAELFESDGAKKSKQRLADLPRVNCCRD